MAKYLVFSDSHGKNERMLEIIAQQKDSIEGLFFLGDIESGEDRLRASIQGTAVSSVETARAHHSNDAWPPPACERGC